MEKDDGVIDFRCGSYILNGELVVRLEFTKPIIWVAMTPDEAKHMAKLLITASNEVNILEDL